MFKLESKEQLGENLILKYSFEFKDNSNIYSYEFLKWFTKQNIWNNTAIDDSNQESIKAEVSGKGTKIVCLLKPKTNTIIIQTNYKKEADTIEDFMKEMFCKFENYVCQNAVLDYIQGNKDDATKEYAFKILDKFFKIDNINMMNRFYDIHFKWMESKAHMKKDINYLKKIYEELKPEEDIKQDMVVKINNEVVNPEDVEDEIEEPVEEDEGITITVNGSNISDDDRHIYKDLSKPIAKKKREQPLESLVKDFSKPMPKKKKVGSVEEKKKVNYAFEVVYAVGTKTLTTQQYDGLIINDREIIIIHDGEENTVRLDTKKIKSLVIECIPALLKMQEEVKEKELKPARKSTRNQIEIKYKEHDIFLNGNILDDPYHEVYMSFENELKNILNYF